MLRYWATLLYEWLTAIFHEEYWTLVDRVKIVYDLMG